MKTTEVGSSVGEVPFHIGNYQLDNLVGRLLTIVDASINDSVQRKALKDVIRDTVWQWIHQEERGVFSNSGSNSMNYSSTNI